jgi:hypothetical protein
VKAMPTAIRKPRRECIASILTHEITQPMHISVSDRNRG